MDKLSFDQLPDAVARLHEKIDSIIEHFNEAENKPQCNTDPELLSATEVAKLLGKSVSTVYSMTSEKRIPFHKRGNKLYFFKNEVLQWIEDGGQCGIANETDFNEHLALMQKSKKHKPSGLE